METGYEKVLTEDKYVPENNFKETSRHLKSSKNIKVTDVSTGIDSSGDENNESKIGHNTNEKVGNSDDKTRSAVTPVSVTNNSIHQEGETPVSVTNDKWGQKF